MNVFISYSHRDKKYADLISKSLEIEGHEIWIDSIKFKEGDNWLSKITNTIKDIDAFILIISKNSLSSEWVSREISAIALGEISKGRTRIIPVLLDKSTVPQYIALHQYVDLSNDIERGIDRIIHALSDTPDKITLGDKKWKRSYRRAISELSRVLKDGRLTLVTGAGISIAAGIPSWNMLLLKLLESMMMKISNNYSMSLKGADPNEFQKRYGTSAIVVGKYLKSNLGHDFLEELRDALYAINPITCDTIKSIVNLAKIEKAGKSLDSIITFNYDSLIEENLANNNIKCQAIYSEGMRNGTEELPIYHVNGYLPRRGKLTKSNEIVFSEEAYHSQFIDPFSWSNLIQLNKLSHNTCLFLGISLTDPNLRRLLDVANRKNPSKALNHYIIKDIPNMGNKNDNVDDLALFLAEQDYNELGLNVIWIEEYSEIPTILNKIYYG